MTFYDPLFAVAQPFAHLRSKELERQLAVEKTKSAIAKLLVHFEMAWYPYTHTLARDNNVGAWEVFVPFPLDETVASLIKKIEVEHGVSLGIAYRSRYSLTSRSADESWIHSQIHCFKQAVYTEHLETDFVIPLDSSWDNRIDENGNETPVYATLKHALVNMQLMDSDDLDRLKRVETFMLHVIKEGANSEIQYSV
jgi:hypothetical protein